MSGNLEKTIAKWLESYCHDIEYNSYCITFYFRTTRIMLELDSFTSTARFFFDVFDCKKAEAKKNPYSGYELSNFLNRYLTQYTFEFDEYNCIIEARRECAINISRGLDFVLKVEIYRLYYLVYQIDRAYSLNLFNELVDDESWLQSLLSYVDSRIAADLLDINILYLHGFASSGNSGTAKEIQECLPNCKVISPDLPINPAEALNVIRNIKSNNQIDLVIGTSMGGMLTLFSNVRNKIVVNPSFHISQMMKRRLDGADSVIIPFLKKRENGETEFELTQSIANSYLKLESNVFLQMQLDMANVLGIFGTDDDVVDCKDEFLTHSLNIRYFMGGHRLTKETVKEVVIPSILQMIINEKLK